MDKTHKIKSVCTFIFVMGMIITLSGNVWARGLPSSPLVYDFEHPNDELVFLPVNSSPFTRVAEADGNWAFLLEEGMIPNITEASGNYRYAILDFPRIDNFVFEIRSKGNLRNPNILLIFGWQDPLNYYYAYLTDSNATRISRVRNGLEEANFLYRTGKSSWNEDSSIYQSARLVVETISDQVIIMVYVNNETEPSLRTSISKDEYTPGNIGFGAYNASGQASYYDDIRLEIINKTGIPLLRQTLTFDDPDDSLVFEPVNQSPFTLHLETNGNRAYCLDASTLPPIDDEEPEHRYGILYPYEMGDFTFDHLVKGFPDNSTNLVVFGWKDPDNYLYVLLSEGTDTKVGRVTGGFDNVLLCPGTDTFWARNASGYQHVRVTLESRADWKYLKVYVNGELKLSYAFSQNLYSGGKVGLGMLNVPEAALYDDLFLDPLPSHFPINQKRGTKALAIANTAGEYYGTPYSPDAGTYNIDCFNSASFMKKIYSLNGINLPSTPISQAMVGKTLPGTDWDHGADFHHLAKIGLIKKRGLVILRRRAY